MYELGTDCGCSDATLNSRLAAIRAFMDYAADRDVTCLALFRQVNFKVVMYEFKKVVTVCFFHFSTSWNIALNLSQSMAGDFMRFGKHPGKIRVYSLRHQFASACLNRWLDNGENLMAMLPFLREYMGHKNLSETAYYIHILPENLIKSPAIDWSSDMTTNRSLLRFVCVMSTAPVSRKTFSARSSRPSFGRRPQV